MWLKLSNSSSNEFNFQIALSGFYETNQDAEMELANAADIIDDNDDDDSNVAVGGAASLQPSALFTDKKAEKKSKTTNRSAGGSRIVTFNTMSSSDEDDDENTGQVGICKWNMDTWKCNWNWWWFVVFCWTLWQAFYAGGSERSGQQVLGPPRKDPKDFVSNIFKSAKESGAEIVENTNSSRPTTSGRLAQPVHKLMDKPANTILLNYFHCSNC